MPGMRGVYRVNKESVHGTAARNDERPWSRGKTAYQPVTNRLQNARERPIVFPETVYLEIKTFGPPKRPSARPF